MSTYAEIKNGKKPEYTFMGRQRDISSGVKLGRGPMVRVARRSEALMEEQIALVKSAQDSLAEAMKHLSNAKSEINIGYWRAQVDQLRKRCDEMVIALQVVAKIQNELMHARIELETATKSDEDVAKFRKRIVWLEERMERLLTRNTRVQPEEESIMASTKILKNGRKGAVVGKPKKQVKTVIVPPSESENDKEKTATKQLRDTTNDFKEEIAKNERQALEHVLLAKKLTDEVQVVEGAGVASKIVVEGAKKKHRQKRRPVAGVNGDHSSTVSEMSISPLKRFNKNLSPMKVNRKLSQGASSTYTEPTIYPADTITTGRDSQDSFSDITSDEEVPQSRGGGRDSASLSPDEGVEEEDPDSVKPQSADVISLKESSVGGNEEEMGSSDVLDKFRDGGHDLDYRMEEDDGASESEATDKEVDIFLTEPALAEERKQPSRVHIVTPKHSVADEVELKDEEEDRDLVKEYWESDHHKFEFGDHVGAILSEEPLSYHSLGLAVPSTFTESVAITTELPWRPAKESSELGDVHKLALDNLAKRIHKMWNRVDEAATASIGKFHSTSLPVTREQTFVSSAEDPAPASQMLVAIARSATTSRQMTPASLPKVTDGRQMSVEQIEVPQTPKSPTPKTPKTPSKTPDGGVVLPAISSQPHSKKAATKLLVYHPKPIPPPDVLPLTRTNRDKKYPRFSSDWNPTVREESEPIQRIVNQMNVAKETSILMFKSKQMQRKTFKPVITPNTLKEQLALAADQEEFEAEAKKPLSLADMLHKPAFALAAMMNKLKRTAKNALPKDSVKFKRIEELLLYTKSKRVAERRDAVKNLGLLKCDNLEIVDALEDRLQNDNDPRVKYESAKSLVTLGCWFDSSILLITKHIKEGNREVKNDLIQTLTNARDTQFANRGQMSFKLLVGALKGVCQSDEPGDQLAFSAAICLGSFKIQDPTARAQLMTSVYSDNTHIRAKSLEILVRQMNATDHRVIMAAVEQLRNSPVWKHRVAATKLLAKIGPAYVCREENINAVFKVLENKLWNDPNKELRREVAITVGSLGLKEWMCDIVERKLDNEDEDVRAEGAIAVGVLGIKADRVVKTLLEMLELDSSEFVRLHVIRTFGELGLTRLKIMRSLKERERSDGPLAREASKVLDILSQGKPKSNSKASNVRRSSTPA